MTAQTIILILAVCLTVCVAVLILGTAYFLRQWKRLDQILDSFRQGDSEEDPGKDGVFSDVLHGSRVTYKVESANRAALPLAAPSAMASLYAWGKPAFL